MSYYNDLSMICDAPATNGRLAPRGAMNPWVIVYLDVRGMRLADASESGKYVAVPTAGGTLTVWATEV